MPSGALVGVYSWHPPTESWNQKIEVGSGHLHFSQAYKAHAGGPWELVEMHWVFLYEECDENVVSGTALCVTETSAGSPELTL